MVRFTDDQMNDEIDRIRKENGWKPRKRGKPGRRGRGSGSSNGGEAPNNTAAADEHVKLLQKLQVSAKNLSSGSSNGGETPNNSAAAAAYRYFGKTRLEEYECYAAGIRTPGPTIVGRALYQRAI